MPNREKIIERLRDMSNICANRGEIQSRRTLDCAIALLTEQDERGLFEDCEDCQEYVSEEHYCPWFCDVIRKTVDELNANAQKWIPVTERLPEVGKQVLVYAVGKIDGFIGESVIAISERMIFKLLPWSDGEETWSPPWQYFLTDFKITHWMPLPESPKEDGDAGI